MTLHHMYPDQTNVAPPSQGRHDHRAASVDVESLSEGDDLPGDLLTWCHLLHWMPSGWAVTPPFRAELGGQWTVVANKTRMRIPMISDSQSDRIRTPSPGFSNTLPEAGRSGSDAGRERPRLVTSFNYRAGSLPRAERARSEPRA